jgi:hypothetical protein
MEFHVWKPNMRWFLLAMTFAAVSPPSIVLGQDPTEVYRRTVRGVVYIENRNLKTGGNKVTGSGFLINKRLRLVVTNYHMTKEEDSVDVYFPAKNANGKFIDDREFYRKSAPNLRRLGYAATGRPVAKDSLKDLAILRLSAIPDSAQELSLADSDPRLKEGLNMMGNPGARPLWRWSRGTVNGIGNYNYVFKNNQRVSFLALHFLSDSFGGNSGGPVLDDFGKVVGVQESSGGDGGMQAHAVHYSEVADLMSTVKPCRIFSIQNMTQATVHYTCSWGDDIWTPFEIPAGGHRVQWKPGQVDPSIRFDASLQDDVVLDERTLRCNTAILGRGGRPNKTQDSLQYFFEQEGMDLRFYELAKPQ